MRSRVCHMGSVGREKRTCDRANVSVTCLRYAAAGAELKDWGPGCPHVGPGGRLSGGAFGCGDAQEFVETRELDAWAPRRLAEGALVAVDRFPAGVGDEVGLAGAQ